MMKNTKSVLLVVLFFWAHSIFGSFPSCGYYRLRILKDYELTLRFRNHLKDKYDLTEREFFLLNQQLKFKNIDGEDIALWIKTKNQDDGQFNRIGLLRHGLMVSILNKKIFCDKYLMKPGFNKNLMKQLDHLSDNVERIRQELIIAAGIELKK